jgi:hypothetical protein
MRRGCVALRTYASLCCLPLSTFEVAGWVRRWTGIRGPFKFMHQMERFRGEPFVNVRSELIGSGSPICLPRASRSPIGSPNQLFLTGQTRAPGLHQRESLRMVVPSNSGGKQFAILQTGSVRAARWITPQKVENSRSLRSLQPSSSTVSTFSLSFSSLLDAAAPPHRESRYLR